MQKLLILGGTTDSALLIERSAQLPGVTVIASLAGRTPKPNIPKIAQVRIGGFGGIEGLIEYLQKEKIDLVVDATHPFATQISHNAAAAAAVTGIPRLMLSRPVWEAQSCDRWVLVESHTEAAEILPKLGNRIFLTTGRQHLSTFAHLQTLWFLMRMITPPEHHALIPPGKILLDQGPFELENEKMLLQEHGIQVLVSKNSGGQAAYAKILAARALELPIVMITRPSLPVGEVVTDVEAALSWITQKCQ
jgi:precorrin-6A/cobalt-precorrin-6A reductase